MLLVDRFLCRWIEVTGRIGKDQLALRTPEEGAVPLFGEQRRTMGTQDTVGVGQIALWGFGAVALADVGGYTSFGTVQSRNRSHLVLSGCERALQTAEILV